MSKNMTKKRSAAWMHFSVVAPNKAKCSYCFNIISFSGGATGNLLRHLNTKHPTVLTEKASYRQDINPDEQQIQLPTTSQIVTETELPASITPTPSTSTVPNSVVHSNPKQSDIGRFIAVKKPISVNKAKAINEQLVALLVKAYLPFNIVENPEFKKFVHLLNSNYDPPCRKTISANYIPQLYSQVKEHVQNRLLDAAAVCLTTDGWTSVTNQSYIAITAHFINKDGALESYLLGCFPINERHTAQNLAAFMMEEVGKWDLIHKVSAIVTDNAANIVAAVRLTNWRHFPCFAHTLNLVVQDSLNCLTEQLKKVKAIVEYFKRSSSALARLREMQNQLNVPQIKLKQDCPTRWNSVYDMLRRIYEIKDAVVSTLAIVNPALNTINADDWRIIQHSINILQIFYEITNEISAEKHVTFSKIILFVKAMNDHICDSQNKYTETDETRPEIRELVQSLKYGLKERFKDINYMELTTQATFLDPRFKKYGFPTDDRFESTLKNIRQKISNYTVPGIPAPTQCQPEISEPTSSSMIWDSFDNKVKQHLEVRSSTAAAIIETDKYLNEPLLQRTENPLKWWNERRTIYPRLFTLMERRLCNMATSVPCERVFSKAGNTINEHRSRLKPEKAAQLIFLNQNLRSK